MLNKLLVAVREILMDFVVYTIKRFTKNSCSTGEEGRR